MLRRLIIPVSLILIFPACNPPIPSPTPSPTPLPSPTVEPTPIPTPTPTPTPISYCPKIPNPNAIIYLANHPYPAGSPASNKRDSSVRVRGDEEFCYLIHGVRTNDCHLEGWENRAQCEMELISGCPVWEYTVTSGERVDLCDNDHNDMTSCDHFGSPLDRDDPDTPEFEGKPKECGLQRNEFGPYAGFFMAVHITPGMQTFVRACRPDRIDSYCGAWSLVIESEESIALRRDRSGK